jgi:hypothetical protein
MTVSEVNALLYLPGHPISGLDRVLRIPALSAGWRRSFEALLERKRKDGGTTGNPGLGPAAGPPPAWIGFRPLRVTHKQRESSNVTSLTLEPTDRQSLTAALPGQFIASGRLAARCHLPCPDRPDLIVISQASRVSN